MACGVFWGILLICFVQAEHVCCLWAQQGQHSLKHNSNVYVGLAQQNSRLGGSSPQNQFRQASVYPASVHSSSLNTQTAVNSGYKQGLFTSRFAQTASQPAQSSVRLVQSSSGLKPYWQTTNSKWNNAQNVPKNAIEIPTAVSGSSVKYSKNQNTLSDFSKKIHLPGQQGTQHTGYLSSSSASAQSPSRQSYSYSKSASDQSAAQNPPSTTYYRQGGSSFSQSNVVPPEQRRQPVRVQTSITAPARRVPYRRPDSSKQFPSPQTGRIGNYLSQAEAGKPFQSKGLPVIVRNFQGRYQPSSISNVVSRHTSYSQSNRPKQNPPVASQHTGNARIPTGQTLQYRPSYNFREQNPSGTNTFQSQWGSRNSVQGAHALLGSGSTGGGPAQRFHPTRVFNIPERFGGHAIRRLKEPADEEEVVVVQKPPTNPPQQPATPPPKEMASYKPKVPSEHPASKWLIIRPPPKLRV